MLLMNVQIPRILLLGMLQNDSKTKTETKSNAREMGQQNHEIPPLISVGRRWPQYHYIQNLLHVR